MVDAGHWQLRRRAARRRRWSRVCSRRRARRRASRAPRCWSGGRPGRHGRRRQSRIHHRRPGPQAARGAVAPCASSPIRSARCSGQCCGGRVGILVERIDAGQCRLAGRCRGGRSCGPALRDPFDTGSGPLVRHVDRPARRCGPVGEAVTPDGPRRPTCRHAAASVRRASPLSNASMPRPLPGDVRCRPCRPGAGADRRDAAVPAAAGSTVAPSLPAPGRR